MSPGAGAWRCYLVRHAKAGRRRDWKGDDRLRPLSDKGRAQAEGLVRLLARDDIARVVSSSFTRCMQTVEPLARSRGRAVETDPALEEGAGGAGLYQALCAPGAERAVFCSHGDVIREWVKLAVASGVDLHGMPLEGGQLFDATPPDTPKGATWVLEVSGGALLTATLLGPP